MIRLPASGAAVFALGMLALPTFALPAREESKLTHADTRRQLGDVNLAKVVMTAQSQSDGAAGLPTRWCGDETFVDNLANAATSPAKPQFNEGWEIGIVLGNPALGNGFRRRAEVLYRLDSVLRHVMLA